MKISQLKMIIREVVREEIQIGLKEIIGEFNQPVKEVSQPKPNKRVVEKKSFTKNSVLNDVLNETAASDEWKTLGGGKLDSSRMNDVVGQNYGDLMNGNGQSSATVNSNDPMAQFLNKDYREVLEKAEEKDNRKHGR